MAENKQTTPQVVHVPEEAPKISVSLIVHCIIYLAVIANAVSDIFGLGFHFEPDANKIYEGVTALSILFSIIYAAYKNHDITEDARIKAEVAKQVDTKK